MTNKEANELRTLLNWLKMLTTFIEVQLAQAPEPKHKRPPREERVAQAIERMLADPNYQDQKDIRTVY